MHGSARQYGQHQILHEGNVCFTVFQCSEIYRAKRRHQTSMACVT